MRGSDFIFMPTHRAVFIENGLDDRMRIVRERPLLGTLVAEGIEISFRLLVHAIIIAAKQLNGNHFLPILTFRRIRNTRPVERSSSGPRS